MRVWRRPTLWVNTALGVLALAGAGWAYRTVAVSGPAPDARGGSVLTRQATVDTGDVIATVSASGTVASAHTAAATFLTSGVVTEIDVKVGDLVSKGQVLAKVDPTEAKDTLKTAQANLTAARAALSRAESADGADEAGIATAKAQVTSAEAAVDSARKTVDGTVLKAPIAGTVIAVNGSVGNPSGAGSSATGGGSSRGSSAGGGSSGTSSGSSSGSGFVQLADLTSMQVSASFAEADATRLAVGQSATVAWNALSGTTATGKVSSISPTSTSSGGVNSYAAVVLLDSVPDGVRIGQSTTVTVTVARASGVLRVPTSAVTDAGGQHTVRVVADGTVTRTPVQIGVRGDRYDEVTSGLTAGQTVQITLSTGTGSGSDGQSGGFPGRNFPGRGGGFPGAGGGFRGAGGGR